MAKNIYQKIAGVMEEVKYIQKTGYNSFHKYKYASEGDYINSIRPALLKQGLVVVSTVDSMNTVGELTNVTMTFKIINSDNPSEVVTFSSAGSGSDKGDKGVYKAITGAKKYFISLAFLIETGDDAEADENVDKRAADSKPSAVVLSTQVAKTEAPKAEAAPVASAEPAKKAPAFRPGKAVAPKAAAGGGDAW